MEKTLTNEEKEILKSLVEYHLKEVKKDSKFANEDIVKLIGAEAKYEDALKGILKKLK